MPYGYSDFGETFFGEPSGGFVKDLYSYETPHSTLTNVTPGLKHVERAIQPIDWDIYTIRPLSHQNGQLLTQAKARKIGFDLTQAHTLSFEIDGEHPEALLIDELIDDVVVYRNGQKMFRGRVGASGDRIDANSHSSAFAAVSYKGMLYRREINTTIDTLAAALDQAEICWRMIAQTQSAVGGNLGIVRGLGDALGTSILRGDTWTQGKAVGAAIDDISQRQYGFDWDISPDNAFDVYFPVRGQQTGFVAEYGSNVTDVQRTLDTTEYANFVRSLGTDAAGTPIIATSELPNIVTLPEGRWDYLDGGGDASSAAEVGSRAAGLLAQMSGIVPSYVLTMTRESWTPADCWLGDLIRLVIFKGRLSVNSLYRVQHIDIDIGDSNDENVQITVGAPIMSLNNRLYFYSRRLDELERR